MKLEAIRDRRELDILLKDIFHSILPEYGYTVREQQIELASHMLDAMAKKVISLSEAGVGIGKTHAYIIAAALIKRSRINEVWIRGTYTIDKFFPLITPMPVIISTSSIALQTAIARDYIPEISKILMECGIIDTPLTYSVRKGKEHYVCDLRLKVFMSIAENKDLTVKLNGAGIDLERIGGLSSQTAKQVNVKGNCTKKCPLFRKCRYMRFLEQSRSAVYDFQISNHNFFLADTIKRSKNERPIIPNYQAVIIDEAHRLLDTARQMYGMEISSDEIPELAAQLHSLVFIKSQSKSIVTDFADKLESLGGELFTSLIKSADTSDGDSDRFKTKINSRASKMLIAIYDCIRALNAELEKRKVIKKYDNLISYIQWALGGLQERIIPFRRWHSIIYWLEFFDHNHEGARLCAIPKNLNERLRNDLWSRGIPMALTSGTLSVNGDFDLTKQKLGLDKMREGGLTTIRTPSPFNYKDNVLLYISENVPFPVNSNANYISAVACEIEKLIGATHGHTAVIFTSYKTMELVIKALPKMPYPLFKLTRNGSITVERFRESKNGVLFASGSMWEGIDLPGDILSSLIIVRLPFSPPDPISEYERERYTSLDEYKERVIVAEMLIKLMQGFGRLIRTERDSGVVSILDSRVRIGGAYRKRVLSALPRCRVTDRINDVIGFIKKKKNSKYFLQ